MMSSMSIRVLGHGGTFNIYISILGVNLLKLGLRGQLHHPLAEELQWRGKEDMDSWL